MLSCIKRKKILTILLAMTLYISAGSCHAAYDVVRATTVQESQEGLFIDTQKPEMYEEADFEQIDTQED